MDRELLKKILDSPQFKEEFESAKIKFMNELVAILRKNGLEIEQDDLANIENWIDREVTNLYSKLKKKIKSTINKYSRKFRKWWQGWF